MKIDRLLMIVFVLCCTLSGELRAAPQPAASPLDDTVVSPAAPAPKGPEDLKLITVGTVTAIPKPDQLTLSDGKIYALDSIRVPVQYNQEAIKYLQDSLMGKQVGIYVSSAQDGQTDRYGSMVAHVLTEDGVWVQQEMVSHGFAWVFGSPMHRDLIKALYPYEDQARKTAQGLWGDAAFVIRNSQTIAESIGSFQVYEGKILNVKAKDDYIIVYFSSNQQTDLRIILKRQNYFTFGSSRETFSHLEAMTGYHVRIRGWVENNNGPMIDLTYPEQIEILNAAGPR